MKEFRENFEEGLKKGLRRFKTNPRNNQTLLECHNWEPTEEGLKPREDIEGLAIVTLPGDIDETISVSDVYWYGDGYPTFLPGRFPSDEPPPTISPPEVTFPCPPVCTLVWNEDFSAETITTPGAGGQNEVSVGTTGGTPPYTWSVSGTGFSLEFTTTDGGNNTLYADDTACGTATITVIDLCGCSAVGYVRASDGEWCLTDIHACTITGDHTGSWTGTTLIKGKYKQTIAFSGSSGSSGPTGCLGGATSYYCNPCYDDGIARGFGCSEWDCNNYYHVNRSTTPCGNCVTNMEEILAAVGGVGDDYEYHGVDTCNIWCMAYGCEARPGHYNSLLCLYMRTITVWEWKCSC